MTRTHVMKINDEVSLTYDHHVHGGETALLVLPGFWRSRKSPRIARLGELLARNSDVMVLDMRGHGDSTGTFTFGLDEPGDLRHFLTDLHARGFRRVGLLGLSMGGYIAMQCLREGIPDGLEILGVALVSSPTHVRRARPLFLSPKALRQLQPSEAVKIPRFRVGALLKQFPDASKDRPATETFPVHVFHNRGDWLIPDGEAGLWRRHVGERVEVKVFDNDHRYHADAMLADGFELEELLLAWWARACP